MITQSEIINLFGTPMSNITVPVKPFELNGVHVIIGLVVLGFAAYGVYKCLSPHLAVVAIPQNEMGINQVRYPDLNLSK